MEELDNVHIHFDSSGLWVLNIALAVVMFGVALDIKMEDFKRLLKQPKLVLIGVLSQFILLPLLTFGLVILIKPQPSIALGMMMVAACPGGNISNFMTHLAKGNTALSVSLTAFATF
jgi:BASS family bile acid:Na+ symporter